MNCSTFKIEVLENKYISFCNFVGENVHSKNSLDIFHKRHNPRSDVNALKISENESFILKGNNILECSPCVKLNWESPYEIQLYCIETADKNTYIVSLGWLNEIINIGDADRAKIHIENTPVTFVSDFLEDYGWKFEIVLDNMARDFYEKYEIGSSISKEFSSKSEFVRVGFEDYMPESLHIEHP